VVPAAILVSGTSVVAATTYSFTGGAGNGAVGFNNSPTTCVTDLPEKYAISAFVAPKRVLRKRCLSSGAPKLPAYGCKPVVGGGVNSVNLFFSIVKGGLYSINRVLKY
jgi:hypothetical protein